MTTISTRPITREQFEAVRPMLEAFRKKTRPRRHDLYHVVCALIFRECTGISWRRLPRDVFPPWRTVHQYWLEWSAQPADGSKSLMVQLRAALSETA